ncbi:MAG: homoserine dehydrogenase [Dehalococcoidia bacterium]|nr:homoserine dehydrogenase [Dehalococcoidia bacterium]MSQ34933.1 homoserine dehydrogenase [Dehalococcoidia bacterium]
MSAAIGKAGPGVHGAAGVGVLGLGVVGSAVARAILEREHTGHTQPSLKLLGAVVRDIRKPRLVRLPEGLLSTDAATILDNPDVSIVVEVMGGEMPAFDYISRALRAGKHVVTANKEVLCKRGAELEEIAAEHGVRLLYEASVGGGIPIIGPLTTDLSANRILGLRAIINGTTNYILTKMAAGGAGFDVALKEAQGLGYAEADPTNDVDGFDAAFKITVLSRLAYRTHVPLEAVYREGIRNMDAKDFRYAKDLGFAIKLIAAAQREEDGLLVRVHPAFVPVGVPMANVNGVLNAVEIEGDMVGPLWFQGRGAGPSPTASAVMGDVLRIAREIESGSGVSTVRQPVEGLRLLQMGEHQCRYYLRLTVHDRAGVLAKIAGALGEMNISIRSVLQMDTDEKHRVAGLVIMTHPAREANMQKAVARIRDLDVVASLDNLIRVESYPDIAY